MEVREVSPSELEIDPLNERNENVGPYKEDESLEESIRKQGVIQPPVARRKNGSLKVIVGQRRTLAAQSTGLESIPVIIVEMDDAEALEASITENVDAFRKNVSRADRAAAIKQLMELNDWSIADVSSELGISKSTVRDWVERTHDEWKDTVVHVDDSQDETDEQDAQVDKHNSNSGSIQKEDIEKISDTDLRAIRNLASSKEEREKAVQKVITEGASQREIREAKKRAERGEGSFSEVIETVTGRTDEEDGGIQVRTEVTFTGNYAEGLKNAARDFGTSEEEVIRRAIEAYLSKEGYVQNQ